MDSFQQSMSDKPLQANKLIKVAISERSLPIVKMTKIRPWVMNGALFSKTKGAGAGIFPHKITRKGYLAGLTWTILVNVWHAGVVVRIFG